MTFQICPVDPSDADVLSQIAFAAKAHWGYPEHWMETWKPQLTFTPVYFQTGESWSAVMDHVLIAFYTLHDRNGIAWLENLWVLPEFIGRGIGRRLFLHAADRSRKLGYNLLQLEADPNAIGFYEKMGMNWIGEKHSEMDGRTRILPVMELAL